jgi:hypothetical protein
LRQFIAGYNFEGGTWHGEEEGGSPSEGVSAKGSRAFQQLA